MVLGGFGASCLGQRRGSGMAMVDESFSAEQQDGTKIILKLEGSQHVLCEALRQ